MRISSIPLICLGALALAGCNPNRTDPLDPIASAEAASPGTPEAAPVVPPPDPTDRSDQDPSIDVRDDLVPTTARPPASEKSEADAMAECRKLAAAQRDECEQLVRQGQREDLPTDAPAPDEPDQGP